MSDSPEKLRQEWEATASQLLRLLMPDRTRGCLCTRCLQDEIRSRTKVETELSQKET